MYFNNSGLIENQTVTFSKVDNKVFLYFVPRPFDSKALKKALSYAFEIEGKTQKRETMSGPNGAPAGVLMADQSVPENLFLLKTDHQIWRKIPGTECQVGRWKDVELSPGNLQRAELLEGESVELADGSYWQVAHARKFVEMEQRIYAICPLPKAFGLNDAGQWQINRVANRYLRLAELAMEYSKTLTEAMEAAADEAEQILFEFDRIDELAVAGLTANYRVGPAELDLYNLYDMPARQRLIDGILDVRTFIAWQKKSAVSAPNGSDSDAGRCQLTADN